MFSRYCFNQIRDLESFLYGGPETVEQVFEREDSFQAHHSRRRENTPNEPSPSVAEHLVWYKYRYDPENGNVVYTPMTDDR